MAKFKFDWDGLKTKIETEEKNKKKGFEKDKRLWSPDKKAESGLYIIRFLPDLEGNPFVKVYSHQFKYQIDGLTKWYIKPCANTFGYDRECPVCKKNMEYYKSSFKSDQELSKQRGRKLKYVANILVIKDPTTEENNGKVMIFEFGQKIYEKIARHMFPTPADQEDPDFVAFIPFDLYEGADFKLKVKQQGDFPNYDESLFSPVKPLGDDKRIEAVMKQTYLLSEFLDESKFPTKDAVIKELGTLLGLSGVSEEVKADDIDDEDIPDFETPKPTKPVKPAKPAKAATAVEPAEDVPFSTDEDEIGEDDKWFEDLNK
jgi:hypothetical protein